LRPQLKFRVLPEKLAVCRLDPGRPVPAWGFSGSFFSAVRASSELSIVCEERGVPAGIPAEKGWVALGLEGPFPFSMTGVLAAFLEPLALAKIPIFAISTFDTDYVLVKLEDTQRAVAALNAAGHRDVSD
jgi:uncharacterized protein